jgi:hypothetical protein
MENENESEQLPIWALPESRTDKGYRVHPMDRVHDISFPVRYFHSLDAALAYERDCLTGQYMSGVYPYVGRISQNDRPVGYRVLVRQRTETQGARYETFYARDYGSNMERTFEAAKRRRVEAMRCERSGETLPARPRFSRQFYSVDNLPRGISYQQHTSYPRFLVSVTVPEVDKINDDGTLSMSRKRKRTSIAVQDGNVQEAFDKAMGVWAASKRRQL